MKFKNLKILVFDVDGVLVYVRDSYRKAIVETVQYYFSEIIGVKPDGDLMGLEDTHKFKMIGGFNNDWELTYAIVLCHLTKLVRDLDLKEIDDLEAKNLEQMTKKLMYLGNNIRAIDPDLDCDILIMRINEDGGGVLGAERTLCRVYNENLETAKKFWFPELIKRIFQEIYLGKNLFEKKYGEKPIFVESAGLIEKEIPLISSNTLEELSKDYHLGIASGRESFEIDILLEKHKLDSFFPRESRISSEEVPIGKPDPAQLLECSKRIINSKGLNKDQINSAYIGDIPDDIRAAKNAGFYSIGCLSGVPTIEEKEGLKKEFSRLGCDLIVDNPDELTKHL